jgi:hypothetical protein
MDGDFAPMVELVKLRKKHQFLLVVDDVSHFYILMIMESKEAIWSLSCRHGTHIAIEVNPSM